VMVWQLGRREEAVALMRQAVGLRATPGSARNLALMEAELGNAAGQAAALEILQQLQENPAP
jgi:hypothetical protein